MVKICVRCQGGKPFSEFSLSTKSRHKDGRQSYCKECAISVSETAVQKHKENWELKDPFTHELKKCPQCGQSKPKTKENWYLDRNKKDGIFLKCKTCQYSSRLEYAYGLSAEEFIGMYKTQERKCIICSQNIGGKDICVDHNHTTGKVRGLLCLVCNSLLLAGYEKVRPFIPIEERWIFIENYLNAP